MMSSPKRFDVLLAACVLSTGLVGLPSAPLAAQATAAPAAAAPARQSGTVKSMDGQTLVVTTKNGDMTVPVAPDALVLQLAPGVSDLKAGTPIKLSDIVVGDRVLTGKAGDAATASRIIVIKSGAIAARNAEEQADWQKRGFSGLVKAVDGNTLTVVAGAKTVKVETTPKTEFRRYASDSIKFQDSKPGTLADIHAGDQLSARGDKSADGSTIEAAEVVTGTFANLSGLLTAVDPAAGTVSFKDLTTKKPVTVSISANAELHKLPPERAAMFARMANPGAAGAGAAAGGGSQGAPGGGSGRPAGGGTAGGYGSGGYGGGAGGARSAGMDLSRMLSRLPTETIADLKPGDAVMLVASPSAGASSYTAITLLSGVDALLTAAPGAQPVTLSPWSLGVPEAGGPQ
jgi:hypothetical protein